MTEKKKEEVFDMDVGRRTVGQPAKTEDVVIAYKNHQAIFVTFKKVAQ